MERVLQRQICNNLTSTRHQPTSLYRPLWTISITMKVPALSIYMKVVGQYFPAVNSLLWRPLWALKNNLTPYPLFSCHQVPPWISLRYFQEQHNKHCKSIKFLAPPSFLTATMKPRYSLPSAHRISSLSSYTSSLDYRRYSGTMALIFRERLKKARIRV